MMFVDTNHCTSRGHCRACRDTGPVGESFRAAIETVFAPPDGWECPHGIPWGHVPTPVPDSPHRDIVQPMLHVAPAFCTGCPDERLFADDAQGCAHFLGNYDRPTPCAFRRAIERGEQCPRGNGPLNQ